MNKKTLILVWGIFLFISLMSISFSQETEEKTYTYVYVRNAAPSVEEVLINPDPAVPYDTLTIKAKVRDLNNDITNVVAVIENKDYNIKEELELKYDKTLDLYLNTYTLNSNAPPGTWKVEVTAIDSGNKQAILASSFKVNIVVSIDLDQVPIDFGEKDVNSLDVEADNILDDKDDIQGFPMKITNSGNTDITLKISGSDMVGQQISEQKINVENLHYNTILDKSNYKTLSKDLQILSQNLLPNKGEEVYFWLTIPSGISEQAFKGDISIQAFPS